ncbi:MAG: Rrf2 family transcriptional regulator [Vicinamibacterales bacterium]|nr:Rrf2 family transcriptional regulator [Vicinamibacterales bacterium]
MFEHVGGNLRFRLPAAGRRVGEVEVLQHPRKIPTTMVGILRRPARVGALDAEEESARLPFRGNAQLRGLIGHGQAGLGFRAGDSDGFGRIANAYACATPGFGLRYDQIGRISETLMLGFYKKTDYALMAMKHLASDPRRRAASARKIAETCDIPVELMAKVLTRLVRSGLLTSHQGVHGGYELAQPPAAISVTAVIEAMDGPPDHDRLHAGRRRGDQFSKCDVRDPLHRIRDRIAAVLAGCSILEMAADTDPPAPPVGVMPSPTVRCASALSTASRDHD